MLCKLRGIEALISTLVWASQLDVEYSQSLASTVIKVGLVFPYAVVTSVRLAYLPR